MTYRLLSFSVSVFAWLLLSGQPLFATTYTADGDVIGAPSRYTVRKNDNLYAIARQFDIGIVQLLAANPGISQKSLKYDTKLTIPTMYVLPDVPHKGIALNLPALRLFYFTDDHMVMTFPIGIGRDGWQTPTGSTMVTLKRKNPVWVPPDSIRDEEPNLPDIVPAGPNNPLGQYALNLGWPGYRIHGTNSPYSIGKRSSHGCVRLYPEDIDVLFHAVTAGTPVTVTDTPYSLGWQGNKLFLEVTPTQEQGDAIASSRKAEPVSLPDIHNAISNAAGNASEIDWDTVRETINRHNGIPVAIAEKINR